MPTTTIRIKVRKTGDFDFNEKSAKLDLQVKRGMRQLLEDIHRVSRPITPMLTADLRGDVRKNVSSLGDGVRGEIEWKRPYSWYQERGYTNGPIKNYTTPGTGAHFAEKSVKKVTSTSDKYFGKKI